MVAPSLAHRVRSGSIRLGLWASVLTFLFIETYAIPDQWRIGHASVVLVLALLAAGVSIGVFVVVAAIGMVASAYFKRSPKQSHGPSGGNGPIDSPAAASRDHPNPHLEAQGTLTETLVLICRIDSGGKSLPIYFRQHPVSTTRQSAEVREPGRYYRGLPVAHRAPVGTA
jgi:hypothetical protein